jgi:hypothetical protein
VTFKDDMTVKGDLATQDPTRRKVNMIRSTKSKDNYYQRNVGKGSSAAPSVPRTPKFEPDLLITMVVSMRMRGGTGTPEREGKTP